MATPPEEDRATAIRNMHKNLVKIGRVFSQICSRTSRHRRTHRHGHYNTPLPHRGQSRVISRPTNLETCANYEEWAFKESPNILSVYLNNCHSVF